MTAFSSLFVFFLFNVATASPLILRTLSFEEGYSQLFGDGNLALHRGGGAVRLSLDQRTGSGFVSREAFLHGFFSASIKLPSDYSAGVIVAFYMSNGDVFKKTHDELDFEFLGNIRGKEWRVQTNIYGNGSTSMGREERYNLWFDPTEDFHKYSILWTHNRIVFYIDDVPVREMLRESMGGAFPSKPMSLYATIWDGSSWATSGGRYKADYRHAPFVAEFTDLVLQGCSTVPGSPGAGCSGDGAASMPRAEMGRFRRDRMTYCYCYDTVRYPVPPAECVGSGDGHGHGMAQRYRADGNVKFKGQSRRRSRRRRRRSGDRREEPAAIGTGVAV